MLGEGYGRGSGTVTGTEAHDMRNSALEPYPENKFSCFLGLFINKTSKRFPGHPYTLFVLISQVGTQFPLHFPLSFAFGCPCPWL